MRRCTALAVVWAALPLADGAVKKSPAQAEAYATGGVRLATPRAGCLLDRTGRIRWVLGLPGSFLLSAPSGSGVLAAGCGEGFAVVKTADSLEWLDAAGQPVRSWPAPPGQALFGLAADRAEAVVYLPETGQWFLATEGHLRPLPVTLGGAEALAVALGGDGSVAAVVRRLGRLWAVRFAPDGYIREERELAEAVAPILIREDGALVWGDGEGIVIEAGSGARRRVALPAAPAELAATGERGIRVRLATGQGQLFVRLDEGRDEICRLPEAGQ
ncbi:MAG: hypothetical protein FJW34_05150 [Acidobacteria bacterium]|nr:hypothetical protein [Acidobacteriota bacterium]